MANTKKKAAVKKHPAAHFIVLRPIPSGRWKRAVKAAARNRGVTIGNYLIDAVDERLRKDGYEEMLDAGKAPVGEVQAAE